MNLFLMIYFSIKCFIDAVKHVFECINGSDIFISSKEFINLCKCSGIVKEFIERQEMKKENKSSKDNSIVFFVLSNI